jgi:hypothetical protein
MRTLLATAILGLLSASPSGAQDDPAAPTRLVEVRS